MSTRITARDRVLVRAPSWLGDFVMAEPVVRALYEHHHEAGAERMLSIAGPARFLALLDGRFAGMQRLAISPASPERARDWRDHDAALLLNGSLRSAWSAFIAGIPLRAGFARGGRSPLLTQAFTPARELGATPIGLGRNGSFPRFLPRPFGAACFELAAWIGIRVRDRDPRLLVSERARDDTVRRLAAAGLANGEPFVLVNAGSRAGSAKGLPAEVLAPALDEIARSHDLPFVIACASGEEDSARVTAGSSSRARTILLDPPAVDLPALVFLSSVARLVLGADGGARHVAQALGAPCVAVCGPTDPRHTAEHHADVCVVRIVVPCGPCHREICPLAGEAHHACMKKIPAGAIARAALDLLERTDRRA